MNGVLQNSGGVSLYDAGTVLTAQGYSGDFASGLLVGKGATADLRSGTNGGFQNLVNNSGLGTLIDGTYVVGGTMKIDGADDGAGGALGINAIDRSAGLTLSGTGQILYGPGAGTNALTQLSVNDGGLSLVKGATLAVSGSSCQWCYGGTRRTRRGRRRNESDNQRSFGQRFPCRSPVDQWRYGCR